MASTVPIIRLEVQGMKHSMQIALMEYQAQLDSDIHHAVEAYCTEANIGRVISDAVSATLNSVIKEEVEKFFRHGEGRLAIAQAVKESILAKKTYTRLDDV